MEQEASEISQSKQFESESCSSLKINSNHYATGKDKNQDNSLEKETNEMDDIVVKEESNQYTDKDLEKKTIALSMYNMPFVMLSKHLKVTHNDLNYLPDESLVIYIRLYRDFITKRREVNLVFEELYRRTQKLITKFVRKWMNTRNINNIMNDDYLQIVDDASLQFINELNRNIDFYEKNHYRCILCIVSTTLRKHKQLLQSNIRSIEGIELTKDVKSIMKSFNPDNAIYIKDLLSILSNEVSPILLQVYNMQLQGYTALEISTRLSIPVNQVNNHLRQARKKIDDLIKLHDQDKD